MKNVLTQIIFLNYESFKDLYIQINFKTVDMNNIINQKYYVKVLLSDDKIKDYIELQIIFKEVIPEINLQITVDIFKKIKMNIFMVLLITYQFKNYVII